MATSAETFALAVEQHRAGRLREAEQSCQQLLAADPNHADGWNLLGIIAYQKGQDDVAVQCLTRALQQQPDHVNAHNNLGTVLKRQGKLAEAISCHHRAVELQPRSTAALNNLGAALKDQGDFAEAANCYRQAIAFQPDFPEAHYNLGVVLQQQGMPAEAADSYRRALQLRPQLDNAHFNLAIALKEQGHFDEAIACFRRALELQPDHPDVLYDLGLALQHLGSNDDALTCYRRILEINPNHASAHFHQAVLLLSAGDFERGWAEYEWRWKTGKQPVLHFRQPPWDGQSLVGKTILLCAEQGLGDTIQFIRYASLLTRLGAHVVVECQRPLTKLLSSCSDIDQLIAAGDELPPFDCYASLLSLPRLLNTTLDTIPANVPYLFADPALVAEWRERLKHVSGFRIGINWHGGASSGAFGKRHIPLDLFDSLAQIPGVQLVSLQKDAGQQQLAARLPDSRPPTAGPRPPILDLGDFDTTHGAFMDTAAIMPNVDLVITSDTSAAHLAGALGVPVWVALPFVPDWRWLLDRADSLWYPTMRLFRQKSPSDWHTPFTEIRAALQQRLQSAIPYPSGRKPG